MSSTPSDLLHIMGESATGGINYVFHCPGCGNAHPVDVPRWSWNGSMDEPTFSPSLLCNQHDPGSRCHSFITDGKIQFLSDCRHSLTGMLVDIPVWDDDLERDPEPQQRENGPPGFQFFGNDTLCVNLIEDGDSDEHELPENTTRGN